MPIGNITQSVSTIPAPPHRGVDVQNVFVNKQEDFQDHLADTTIDELNTLKDQLNSRIGEINSTTTIMNGYADTASAGASTATTKAGEASTSASQALTYRNQASTSAAEAAASATSLTPSGILTAIKTVDGAGSGLDADLLDGKDSSSSNAINTIVARDASGNFSAGTISASLNGNANTATTLQNARTINGVSFNGSANITVEDSTKLSTAGGTLSGHLILNNGTLDSPDISFVSNTGSTPSHDINVDMSYGNLRWFRNSGLSPLIIGSDNNLYADNGTTGIGRILTSTTPLGYSTSSLGVGGTVVQAGSKTNPLTLNKLTGLISSANSPLPAGASKVFTLLNNLINTNDGFYVTPYWGYIDPFNYKIEVVSTHNGGAGIKITNISTNSLEDIVQFKFQVVKGVIS